MRTPLVSCVCTTYGRHTIMNRLISMFLAQRYEERELIILNTALVPLVLDASLTGAPITLVNQQTYGKTGTPYRNRGNILEDATQLATGEIFCLFDDDDIYLPWHVSQGVEKLLACGKKAWKPKRSFFSKDGGQT